MSSTATNRRHASEFNRVPPHSEDAERAVLGAILLNPDAAGTVSEILHGQPSDIFYLPDHVHLYSAMLALYRAGRPIDAVSLREYLMSQGRLNDVGGLSYIAELSSMVPTSANAAYYAKIVMDKALLRGLISCGMRMAASGYDAGEDVQGLLDRSESELFKLAERRQTSAVDAVSDLLPDAMTRIEAAVENRSGCTGIASGFKRLDNLTSGFQPGEMAVLAARPSVGKTAMALNIARRAAVEEGRGVLVFSLEMNKDSLVKRLLCMQGGVDAQRLRSGYMNVEEIARLKQASDQMQGAPLYIDDTAGITSMSIRAKARRHCAMYATELIIIDYLQLMSSGNKVESRQQEITEISRHVKAIARELNVAVLALSQLNRQAEQDEGRPKLSHLRESGSIEQDADLVMLMYRDKPDNGKTRPADVQQVNLDLAKQRNGPTGLLQLVFERPTQRFFEPAGSRDEESAERAPAAAKLPYGDDSGPYGDDEEPF